jgi:hypothetical protein
MPRCRNCGASNRAANSFCEDCGQSLSRDGESSAAQPAPPAVVQIPEQEVPVSALVTAASPTGVDGARPPPAHRSGTASALQLGRARLPAREQGLEPTSSGVIAPVSQPMHGVPKIAGTHIALSEGETLWRTYPVTHFRPFRHRATGTLYVTDSRIVLHSKSRKLSGRSLVHEEVRIESVTGLSARVSPGMGLLGILATIALFLFGIVSMTKGGAGVFFGLIFVALAGILALGLYYGFGGVGLQIYTSQTTPGPVGFGYNPRMRRWLLWLGPLAVIPMIIGGASASDVLLCYPERNVEEVISELGALIYDLNRTGTLTGTQWDTTAV